MTISITYRNKYNLPLIVAIITAGILSVVQLKLENPMILAERFRPGGGWVEIFLISIYAAFLSLKMSDPVKLAVWRRRSWMLFSIVFFSQLILGIVLSDKFLMTGKLHLPIPMLILTGPIYRTQISFMTILFLSTVVLSGPAWCSQLCYFGALDNQFAQGRTNPRELKRKMPVKHTGILLIVSSTIILRLTGVSPDVSLFLAIAFGIGGIALMILLSRKQGKMIHCITFCPIGTLVSYLKFINPFRMKISSLCTLCGNCSKVCKYDALSFADLENKKPGLTCTYCGDCLSSCKFNAIYYQLWKIKPPISHKIYLGITITLHAVFMALARI